MELLLQFCLLVLCCIELHLLVKRPMRSYVKPLPYVPAQDGRYHTNRKELT